MPPTDAVGVDTDGLVPLQRELLELLTTDAVGSDNAVSSTEIADRLGIDESNGNPVTRFEIRDLMRETGVPIGSNADGYFVIATEWELTEYLSALDDRIAGIEDRKRTVAACFNDSGPRAVPQQTLGGYVGSDGGDGA